ncbi:protein FATTY ACID EXPORT 6-like [Phragmites australis]|uniref:protein FATTY ACID EXPORT 6-like n=1 Tax=Phragmites australis TaxID=29695 RepID=UPI002D78A271|nr:protein FATTY ACID EXPORT 6-like [Phragmites australis]
MADFYVTIPYGLVVLGGGVAGYVKRGSAASLAAGAGFGGALLLAGALSAWAFARGESGSVVATVLQTVCALALTVVMGIRYIKTRKIMPAGVIATISVLVLIFYVYKISIGGNKVYFPVSAE